MFTEVVQERFREILSANKSRGWFRIWQQDVCLGTSGPHESQVAMSGRGEYARGPKRLVRKVECDSVT